MEKPKLKTLVSRDKIRERVLELAKQIDAESKGGPLVAIGVLQGSFVFFSDLVRQMETPLSCEFLSLSGYPRPAASGEVKILLDIEEPLEGQDLLLIEDLVDTGATLDFLRKTLQARRPRSIKTCSLLVRKNRPAAAAKIDYVGFEIENKFVVGYGIDHEGRYRELPDVCELEM